MNDTNSRLEKLENPIHGMSKKLESISRKLGEDVENKFSKVSYRGSCPPRNNTFWGWAFLGMGFLILNRHIGWFAFDFPVWAIVLIVSGAYMIFKSRKKE